MSLRIPSLDLLIHELTRLPGIGEKTAQRLAYFILKSGDEYSKKIQAALKAVVENVCSCEQCFAYTEASSLCAICNDASRDGSLLCVVEQPSDILRVENSGVFRGRYHVLHGAISPLDGILPEDLKISELIARVKSDDGASSPVKEVILALDADLEGDTTALYISKLLHPHTKLTRIAHGVPFGQDIDYIDQRTLGRALENRVEI